MAGPKREVKSVKQEPNGVTVTLAVCGHKVWFAGRKAYEFVPQDAFANTIDLIRCPVGPCYKLGRAYE